jgi:hypothetical protein
MTPMKNGSAVPSRNSSVRPLRVARSISFTLSNFIFVPYTNTRGKDARTASDLVDR